MHFVQPLATTRDNRGADVLHFPGTPNVLRTPDFRSPFGGLGSMTDPTYHAGRFGSSLKGRWLEETIWHDRSFPGPQTATIRVWMRPMSRRADWPVTGGRSGYERGPVILFIINYYASQGSLASVNLDFRKLMDAA